MRLPFHRSLSFMAGCAMSLILDLACGGGGGSVPPNPVAPTITSQPQDRTVSAGQSATFTVTAVGTAPLAYQWKRGSTDVGGNSPSFTLQTASPSDHGAAFRVVITNAAGQAESDEAVLSVTSSGGAIIINHANTDLAQVPSAPIDAARQSLRIAYGHTSHGSQLVTGMNALASSNPLYAWNEDGTGGALKLDDYAMGGDVGYYPDWVNNTRAYLGTPDPATGRGTGHADVNVIIWSWCGQASGRTEQAMIDTYLAPMSQLEADYPGVRFVYMTGHLDGSGTGGNLNQRNDQIRAYCQANHKVLFDFADIESYDPSGNEFLSRSGDDGCDYSGGNWASQWIAAHPGHELTQLATSCDECAHSQRLNCILKARAAWWLWARLAGWGGL